MSELRVYCPPSLAPRDGSLERLAAWSRLPGVDAVVALPDLHWKSRNPAPTGAVLASEHSVFPAFLDTGPGCGMTMIVLSRGAEPDWPSLQGELLAALTAPPRNLSRDELTRLLSGDAMPRRVLELGRRSLGRLGGGNHFAELHEVVAMAGAVPPEQPLRIGDRVLMIHSGSGRLGRAVGRLYRSPRQALRVGRDAGYHLARHPGWFLLECMRPGRPFWHTCARAESAAGRHMRAAMAAAERWGAANRRELADRLIGVLRAREVGEVVWSRDYPHNHVVRERIDGRALYVHRHGAAAAEPGTLLPLPEGPGADVWLVEPLPSNATLRSCNHGAGRDGAEVTAARYKPLDAVLAAMEEFGLARRVARCRPRVVFKLEK